MVMLPGVFGFRPFSGTQKRAAITRRRQAEGAALSIPNDRGAPSIDCQSPGDGCPWGNWPSGGLHVQIREDA
jgi:hypothetical protein